MCIIIDVNNLGRVFNPKNNEHAEFVPVFDWIMKGKGKLVIGGTTFEKEIAINKWFLPFLGQLSRIGKVARVPSAFVDQLEEIIIKETENDPDFDDQHLVSLLAISKCNVICSGDARAYVHFKTNKHLPHKPKIYTSSKNRNLLVTANICQCCKPDLKINKQQYLVAEIIMSKLKR